MHTLALTAVLGLLLAIAGLLWLASGALAGELRIRFGWPAGLYAAFIAFAVLSSFLSENWFAGLRWCLLMAVYGLAAFLTLQLAERPVWRRFLLACLTATGAALAVYALWHYALYMPALRRWLAEDPDFVLAATGARGGLAGDLAARVRADRAYGSFITPNQMACFLAMVFFPLAGLLTATRGQRGERGGLALWAPRIALVAALLATAAALWVSRSKGGAVAFAFGLAVFAGGTAAGQGRARRARLTALVVAAVVVVGAGFYLMRGSERLRASLGVRLGYWQTSLRMAAERPLTGVGPDSWPEWYGILKEPEYEETRAAHNAYLQLLAETGIVGLLLWCATWAAFLLRCAGNSVPRETPSCNGTPRRAAFAAPALAALALAIDAAFLGTLAPPLYVPGWLVNAPWLPYALVWLVWAVVFVAALTTGMQEEWRGAWIGAAAGLGAFLVHSAGDVTLRVPAIGLATAVLAGLLLGSRQRCGRELRVGRSGATALLAGGAVLATVWSLGITRPALAAALSLDAAEAIRLKLISGRVAARELPVLTARVRDEYERTCRAVPWDARAWRERGAALLWLAGPAPGKARADEALKAAQRAVDLDPLGAANWSVLSQARRAVGDAAGALEAVNRAAQLQTSLPAAWYAAGRASEEAGQSAAAAADYRHVWELIPRQYHPRNRVPAGAAELARFWRTLVPGPLPGSLLDLAREIIEGAGGVTPLPRPDGPDELTRFVEGIEGSQRLLQEWPELGPQARERRLYEVLGPRLWELALTGKVRALEEGDSERPPDAGVSGQGARR